MNKAIFAVGSYLSAEEGALRLYDMDLATVESQLLCAVPLANVSFLAQGAQGVIYAVTESDTENSLLTALRITDFGRRYEIVSQHAVQGNSPCYVAVSPEGSFVATANYGDGTVSVFPILADGGTGPVCKQLRYEGSGPVERRQACSRAHCIAFSPDGKYMFVTNLGADRIYSYRLDRFMDTDTPDAEVALRAGSGPRHLIFNRRGDKAYVINEISDTVTVFDHREGVLTPIQYIDADTAGAHGAGDIRLSADERYLYASLRLRHEGIATFEVDPVTGLLTHLGHTATGGHPRCFCIVGQPSRLLAACRDADAVEIYAADADKLTLAGSISQPRAVFVSRINM